MSRPGFALVVDERTPKLLTVAGAQVRLERFPQGTTVLYPAEALPSWDPTALVDQALSHPVAAEPLAEKLRPGMKLTIVIGDVEPVLPRMRFDIRRTLVERVLEVAARQRVDDVTIIVASGLGTRWRAQDVAANLGDRVAASFLPEALITSHDVTSEELVQVAEVAGQPVKLPARIVDSDLVVSIDLIHGPVPRCPLAIGATDVATINRTKGLTGTHQAYQEVAAAIHAALPVFAISAVLGQPYLGRGLSFLNRWEWEWRLPEQLAYAGSRQWVSALPWWGSRHVHAAPRADYQLLDVIGGAVLPVLEQAGSSWRAANCVPAKPSKILVTSAWGSLFDEGDPVGSPISAAHQCLVERTGFETNHSLVEESGVVVAFHPLSAVFSRRSNAPVADFLAAVLPHTRSPHEIAQTHEPKAMQDEWYIKLYREHAGPHPLASFHTWYSVARASEAVSTVIWVGADRENARLMGHRAASTLADALELAREVIGQEASINYLRGPGQVLGTWP